MYRIKMLCYDDQNGVPYEDVSLECYKTEREAKNAATQIAVQEVSELNVPDADNHLSERTYLVSTYTGSDACCIRSEYRENNKIYPLTEYYVVPLTETKRFLEKLSNATLCIDLKDKNIMGFIYYNPNSRAGGQLVCMYLTYKKIQSIYERVVNEPWESQFLAILESEALCDSIDCDADLFGTAVINLMPKKSVCDYNLVSIKTYVDERLKEIENNKRADEAEFYGQLIDAVENFLDERNVTWPNSEREGCEDAAIIFGDDYDELKSAFQNIIDNWFK